MYVTILEIFNVVSDFWTPRRCFLFDKCVDLLNHPKPTAQVFPSPLVMHISFHSFHDSRSDPYELKLDLLELKLDLLIVWPLWGSRVCCKNRINTLSLDKSWLMADEFIHSSGVFVSNVSPIFSLLSLFLISTNS